MSGNGHAAPAAVGGSGRLASQSVLITGAGSGLGRECALLFAAEGANVVVTDLVPARVDRVVGEVRAAGGQAVGAAADVRVAQDTVDAVMLAVSAYGQLDVLMCSAGVPEEGFGALAFEDISVEGFTSMLATNLTGVFLAARAAVPVMSGVCLPATDGGNLARTSIIFPGDLGGEAGVLPAALARDIT